MTAVDDSMMWVRDLVDTRLAAHLLEYFRGKNPFADACAYALRGGKRIRSCLVVAIVDVLRGGALDAATLSAAAEVGLSVEYVHTASLVVDDLPCMDNDAVRRGAPSTHVRFGEHVAQLVSISLCSMSFHVLGTGMREMAAHFRDAGAVMRARLSMMECVAENIGYFGAASGQLMDVTRGRPPEDAGAGAGMQDVGLQEVIRRKTGVFFQMACVIGWLAGGGDDARVPSVASMGQQLGMAYQVADDIQDVDADVVRGRASVNYANVYGLAEAREEGLLQIAAFEASVVMLGLDTGSRGHAYLVGLAAWIRVQLG